MFPHSAIMSGTGTGQMVIDFISQSIRSVSVLYSFIDLAVFFNTSNYKTVNYYELITIITLLKIQVCYS